jgi:hypothetical protein
MQGYWKRGDHVILRDPLETRATRVYTALTGDEAPNLPGWPYVVVEDTDERVALWLPEGTKLWRWDIEEQRFREPRVTQGDSLRLLYPGRQYQVALFFESGSGPAPWVQYLLLGAPPSGYEGRQSLIGTGHVFDSQVAEEEHPRGRFYGWKVDIIAPFRRTRLGFDVTDEVLDVVVRPDHSHALKDADQMEEFVRRGVYTRAEADRLHASAREVIDLVERGWPPFDDTWSSWRPTPDLGIPEAPAGWHLLPLPDSEWGAIHRRLNPGQYM